MNKESKINLNASDYAISHCDSDKTYNGLEVHKMLCDAYIAGNLDDKDEKIRKALINVFATHKDYEIFFGVSVENIIAWLEKQNHDGKKWIYEDAYIKEREQLFQDGIDEVLENPQKYGLEKQGKQKTFDYKNVNIQQKDFAPKSALEAINEEKVDNTDKVEPKFKVGDWIVNEFHDICLITDIDLENSYYICKSNRFGNTEGDIDLTDKEFHLWNIEDAKDGDVLVASDDSVFIFARVDGYGCIHHIALANDGVLKINPRLIFSWENVKSVKPATKEQRDLLFAKMHEAGYEWNADKKELTKE